MERIRRPPGPRYACIKKSVQHDVIERIDRMRLPGVWTPDTTARFYPNGASLCHVVGFSNLEGVGSAGVEMRQDRYLKGRPGLRETEKDGRRGEVYSRRGLEVPPQEGCDVYLTIDLTIQYLVEKALDRALVEHNAKGAWAIVQHVKTGRILAMASRPDYDLNHYRRTPPAAMLNQALGNVYEPGSTMKAITFAAAFNEGIVSEHELVDCENGIWFYRGRPLRDFHPYGMLSVADVLKKSSNIGTAKIALRLGEARLEEYLRAFGIGRPSGIDLPGEEVGLLKSCDTWSSLSVTRIPMGHEVGVTALQVASAYSAIANNGFLMRPLIVDRVVDPEGSLMYRCEPEVVARPISEAASRTLRRLLMRVTEDGGTARRARVEGYDVAGKTGTAEKVVNGRYDRSANVASFVGFLPALHPELTIIAVVDEPQPFHTGGRVAAPIFKEIADQVVRYLAVPPDGTDNLLPLLAQAASVQR
jgi:cell division protein FtsI/penicillin-binding protein 2